MKTTSIPTIRIHPALTLLAGFLAGAFLGVLARLWMRWISTDPEFSWSGTIFIIGAFAVFATAQSAVLILRQRIKGRTATRIVRGFGALFSLQIFFAGAAVLFPSVLFGSLAIYRKEFSQRTRTILLLLTLPGIISLALGIAANFGWTFATLGRIVLLITIYGLATFATMPTVIPQHDPNRPPKETSLAVKVLFVIGFILISLLFLLLTMGLPGR